MEKGGQDTNPKFFFLGSNFILYLPELGHLLYNDYMKLELLKVEDEARGTKSFYWEPEKPVNYLPGQYFYFTLPELKYPDPRGSTRHFTLSSSPTEGTYIRNTTRIRQESGFKKSMAELPIGTVIEGEGPEGTFVFDGKEPGPHIFIAGGIGITPFRSMIKYAFDKKSDVPMHLIYTNSDNNFIFGQELEAIDKASNLIQIALHDSSKLGHLNDTSIQKYIKNWQLEIGKCTFWLCGPPKMTDAMQVSLGSLNISFGKVKTEKFTGY